MEADVEFVTTIKKKTVEYCTNICNKTKTCDFFVYMHFKRQCDLLQFKRRSFVAEIGLTSDAIFCIKPSMNVILLLTLIDKTTYYSKNEFVFKFELNIEEKIFESR